MTVSYDDLTGGNRVRDNYDPAEFIEAYRTADSHEEREDIRGLLRQIEDGRFHEFLDEAHNLLAQSDRKRQDHWADHVGEWLTQWVRAFDVVEDLNDFPHLSPDGNGEPKDFPPGFDAYSDHDSGEVMLDAKSVIPEVITPEAARKMARQLETVADHADPNYE